MSSVRPRHLMVLPGGLVVGHLAASIATGRPPLASVAGSALVPGLLCGGLLLAGGAGLAAARDGWRGRSTSASGPLALVVQQVVAFVGLDLVEQALTGRDPSAVVRTAPFWVALGAHAAAGALAWVALRLATRLGRNLARLRLRSRGVPAGPQPASTTPRQPPARVIALSSLSRRGPPPATAARLT